MMSLPGQSALVGLLQHAALLPALNQQGACSTGPEAHPQKAAHRLGEGLPVIPQDFSHQPAAPGSPPVLRDEGGSPLPLSHPLTFQELLFLPFSIKVHRKHWLRACTAGNVFTLSPQTLKQPIPGGKAQVEVFKRKPSTTSVAIPHSTDAAGSGGIACRQPREAKGCEGL